MDFPGHSRFSSLIWGNTVIPLALSHSSPAQHKDRCLGKSAFWKWSVSMSLMSSGYESGMSTLDGIYLGGEVRQQRISDLIWGISNREKNHISYQTLIGEEVGKWMSLNPFFWKKKKRIKDDEFCQLWTGYSNSQSQQRLTGWKCSFFQPR